MDIHRYYLILSEDELKNNSIRTAIFTANCIDKIGTFAHETGYDRKNSWPFVIKSGILHSLPKILSNKEADVLNEIEKVKHNTDGVFDKLIKEIKYRMEYVSFIGYSELPCLCGEDFCKQTHFSPLIRGLSKDDYHKTLLKMRCEPIHN